MASATVRISEKSRMTLRELAAQSGESMQAVLDRLIEKERRRQFFEAANAEYAALRRDPEAWAEYQAELTLWECTLMDGLDPNEVWTAEGEVTYKDSRSPVGE